ncbi:2-aminomuconic semialdehyde dehydrogenase-like [Oscarella lobularis]|uniref:2-aminomuconic semialdehyde dehydrogenase-like n=1 Tax=Oscarella lobularis TaxID=121494 RepID=UPI0033137AB1
MKIADLIESNSDELARSESKDQGKPISLAKRVDIPRAIHNFRFFASAILHTTNTSTILDGVGAVNYTQRIPVGVAGLISPWNLPLYLLTFKLAPALATGNTVVAKPSEMTSVTAWMLAKLFNEAGLPSGVCNIVFGTGPKAGSSIVCHPDVSLVSFTGSTLTGEIITKESAFACKKLSLELGGKNPAIIFEDADLDKCVPTTLRSSFANQGEVCLCTSRIYVQEKIYDKFLDLLVSATKKIIVGPPENDSTVMGALISKEHLEKVRGYVELAQKEGGKIECGEEPLFLPDKNKQGYFMRPIVVSNLSDGSRCMQEEIFGPITCVVPFKNEEEVIERANNVKYGLSATVWSENLSRVHRVAQRLDVGTVWTNCWLIRDLNVPFGGMKSSGIGREGLHGSIDFFTEQKTICVKL